MVAVNKDGIECHGNELGISGYDLSIAFEAHFGLYGSFNESYINQLNILSFSFEVKTKIFFSIKIKLENFNFFLIKSYSQFFLSIIKFI
jgi:hypothetical protein